MEMTIPTNELPFTNGTEPAAEKSSTARVDVERRAFITSRGDEILLSDKPVSGLIVQRLQQEGKPKMPMREVMLLGKHKQLEPDPHNEGYVALLKEWETESNLAVLRYLIVVGVKGYPDETFTREHEYFFPGATAHELKYLWVASLLPDDDLEFFTEAVMGATLPTTKGLQQAADSFPGNG